MVTTNNNNDGSIPQDKDPLFQSVAEQTVARGRGRPRKIPKRFSPMGDSRLNNIEATLKNLVHLVKQGQHQHQAHPTNPDPENKSQKTDPGMGDAKEDTKKTVPSMGDVKEDPKVNKYKDLFVESQKRVMEVENVNLELKKKLAIAHAKIDGYEKGQQIFAETFGHFKDAYLISCMTKNAAAADAVPGFSPMPHNTPVPKSTGKRTRKTAPRKVAPSPPKVAPLTPKVTPSAPAPPVPPKPATRRNTKSVGERKGSPVALKRKITDDAEI